MNIEQIIDSIKQYATRHVTVTGGEPLAQKNCIVLLKELCDEGYEVSLETSGALLVDKVDARVTKVMDIKTPASREDAKNKLENLACLSDQDQLKFVICDESDYHWCKSFISDNQLDDKCELLFSPSHGQLEPDTLAGWILRDQLNVRLQIQLHKYLWGEKQGV